MPQHLGADGADAWTDKSAGAVFLPVLLHAGTTALTAGAAAMTLRMRPAAELAPQERGPSPVNRPATRASALRIARATLLLGFCIGLSAAATCTVMLEYRSRPPRPRPAAARLPGAHRRRHGGGKRAG
ncbi:hypothetical protein ACFSJS_25620 [Streptomyces desertarenae]|uniref:DUF1648 domain-containing protein n=1 Tax=Streptomyces desertarenae TaxID=2666184 RepID=A0ABW4PRT4_9ACTN